MTDPTLIEDIRSLLISCPHGLTVREFLSDYKKIIGADFPYRKHGYKSPEDFLTSIPDVVKVSYKAGEKILTAVADEKTAHIQKLVANQKKTKSSSNKFKRTNHYVIPCRNSYSSFNVARRKIAPSRTYECFTTPPRFENAMKQQHKHVKVPCVAEGLENYILQVLKNNPKGIKLRDFNGQFCQHYGYLLDPSQHGFHNIEELMFSLSDSVTVQNKGQYLVAFAKSTLKAAPHNERNFFNPSNDYQSQQRESKKLSTSEDYDCDKGQQENYDQVKPIDDPEADNSILNDSIEQRFDCQNPAKENYSLDDEMTVINGQLKEELKMVIQNHPDGLCCTLLLNKFKELTGNELNLQEIGFSNVMELVSALPEIFYVHRPEPYSPWMLFDAAADNAGRIQKSNVQKPDLKEFEVQEIPPYIKWKIIELLKEYPYGIFINKVNEKFKKKFKDSLPFKKLGYSSIDTLMISLIDDIVTVHQIDPVTSVIKLIPNAVDKYTYARPFIPDSKINEIFPKEDEEVIPMDAILPGTKFTIQDVGIINPESPYIHVRVSQVTNGPELFYVQIIGENTTEKLDDLMNDLEGSYSCVTARDYKVRPEHLVKGFICAVLYEDSNWHRGILLDIENDNHLIYYVDYGTVMYVKAEKIRYLKKKFLEFPAQAIRSRLANIRPANGQRHWSKEACVRFFELSVNEESGLQAWIISMKVDPITKEQELSLCLCDMSARKEIHINDLLVHEGFGELFNSDGNAPLIANNQSLHTVFSMGYYQAINEAMKPLLYSNLSLLTYPYFMNPSYKTAPDLPSMPDLNHNPCGSTSGYFNGCPLSGLSSQVSWDLLLNSVVNNPSFPTNPKDFTFPTNPKSTKSECKESKSNDNLSSDSSGYMNMIEVKKTEPSVNHPSATVNMSSPKTKSESGENNLVPIKPHSSNQDEYSLLSSSDIDISSISPRLSDEILERLSEVLDNIPSPKRRYVKYVKLTKVYEAHMILFKNNLNMISMEISKFFSWKKDLLRSKIRARSLKINSYVVSEEEEPLLFEELKRYHLCEQDSELPLTETLYPLDSVLIILRILQHSSPELIQSIMQEKMTFTPLSSYWGLEFDDLLSRSSSGIDVLQEEEFEEYTLKILNNRRNLVQNKLAEENNSVLEDELKLLNERINGLKT